MSVTDQKIRRLLEELRSWAPGERRLSLRDLQEKFDLEPFVIETVARSEGLELGLPDADEQVSDPAASTIDLDPVEIHRAAAKPDPDESYQDEDTGRWRRKPSGEWELVDGNRKEGQDD